MSKTQTGMILEEREKYYGDFVSCSRISQKIKDCINEAPQSNIEPHHREALDMIALKMARIVNGDPNCTDSWLDIAGYATLIVEIIGETDV